MEIMELKMIKEKFNDECRSCEIRQFTVGEKIYASGFDLKTGMPITRQYGNSIEDEQNVYQNDFDPIERLVISVRNDEQQSLEKE